MTLSPEQFNLLVTKDDLKDYITEEKFDKTMDKVFDTLDVIVKKLDNIEKENVSNISAHARINRDLIRIKDQAKIDSMEVVEQV